MRYHRSARLGLLMLTLAFNALAQNPTEEDLSLSYGNEEFVSIATGQKQLISKAPAVATVITAEDIKAIGATDLDEILETVPGLHVAVSANSSNPIYTIRGIYSDFNPQVLVLINGIPVTNVFLGNRGQMWGGMPVENIGRIEVIRGPGSAIYGADAYAGVINIITKTADQIDGSTLGLRGGSFETNDAWYQYGGELGDWDLAYSLEYHKTDGHEGLVESDLQTIFDGFFGTDVSLAPGKVNTGVESLDTRLDLSHESWQIRFGYQERKDLQTYAGVAEALDPVGTNNGRRINVDVTYHKSHQDWDIRAQLSYFDVSAEADLTLFPPGAVLPIGSDGNIGTTGGGNVIFTDGAIGNPDVFERHLRASTDAFYTGFNDHNIRFGVGFSHVELEGEETKNFGPGILDGTEGTVDGAVTSVTNTPFTFISNEDRDNSYFFIQDEWSIAADWKLTSGIRYDNYSDFGDAVNPRLALVWETGYNMTSKILYGRAFRAPSFAEQFNINNPVILGNPDLDPETIDTFELALDFTLQNDLKMAVNIFSYEMDDIIRFTPDASGRRTAQNTGRQTGSGFEWELKWDLNDNMRLSTNYAFQNSKNKETNSDAPNAPEQQLYIRWDWNFVQEWSLHTQVNYVADRKRETGDMRDEIDNYTKADLTLTRKSNDSNIGFSFYVKNLFDEEIKEPSLAPGSISNDLPLAERNYLAEINFHW